MNIVIPIHGIKLIDFSSIFTNRIEPVILNELDSYKLITDNSINIRNKDTKRIIYHYVIKGLCDYVLSVKGINKIVIVYSETVLPTKHLHKFTNPIDLQEFINNFISKISKMLPIRFLYLDDKFKTIRQNIKNSTGDGDEVINRAKCIIDKFDISQYTFTKARSFSKRYGLEYLSNNYFKQIVNKQLILC
jgi:hypothetical protein